MVGARVGVGVGAVGGGVGLIQFALRETADVTVACGKRLRAPETFSPLSPCR